MAHQTLRALGAVDSAGRVTPRGRAIAAVGVHPRLARALLVGADAVGVERAAEVVALLSENTVGGTSSDDLVAVWRRLRTGSGSGAGSGAKAGDSAGAGRGADRSAVARWREEARRLRSSVPKRGRAAAAAGSARSAPSA
nr:hypothetical protein [Micromonospora sp. DSM 115978]